MPILRQQESQDVTDEAPVPKPAPMGVYNIRDGKEGQKAFWKQVGVAFPCKDGSINVLLDCVPLDGRMNIRERSPKEKNGAEEVTG